MIGVSTATGKYPAEVNEVINGRAEIVMFVARSHTGDKRTLNLVL